MIYDWGGLCIGLLLSGASDPSASLQWLLHEEVDHEE